MESLIEYRFFALCAPGFYSTELKKIIAKQENKSLTELLATVDSLVGLLTSRCVPYREILEETFKEILETVDQSKEIVKNI